MFWSVLRGHGFLLVSSSMSLTFLFVVLQECDWFTGHFNSCRVTITGAAPKFLESKLNKAQAGRVEGDSERLWPSQSAQSGKHPKEMEPTSLPQTKHYRQCADRDPKSNTVRYLCIDLFHLCLFIFHRNSGLLSSSGPIICESQWTNRTEETLDSVLTQK